MAMAADALDALRAGYVVAVLSVCGVVDEQVDMSFGTGAVKITPAHDPNDYECGKRHSLEFINIFNPDGTVNANGAPFEGVMRYDARIAVEKALEDKGLLRGKEPNKMRLGICSRSGDIVEPYLTPQWSVSQSGSRAGRQAAPH